MRSYTGAPLTGSFTVANPASAPARNWSSELAATSSACLPVASRILAHSIGASTNSSNASTCPSFAMRNAHRNSALNWSEYRVRAGMRGRRCVGANSSRNRAASLHVIATMRTGTQRVRKHAASRFAAHEVYSSYAWLSTPTESVEWAFWTDAEAARSIAPTNNSSCRGNIVRSSSHSRSS